MNDIIKKTSYLIRIEDIIVSIFLLIVFSFQFHWLWIVYDFLSIWSIYFFLKNANFILLIKVILAFSVFFILSFLSGFHLISFLSIWDNGKHLFVIFLLFKLIDRYEIARNLRFINHLGIAISLTFLIKIILVFFQYFSDYHMDDVSGTFGYGGSHSLGYFCLLLISYLLYIKKWSYLVVLVSIVSFILNFMAENMGFYLLFILLVSFNFSSSGRLKYLIFIGFLFILFVFFFDFLLAGDFIAPMMYRFSEFLNITDFDSTKIKTSRGFLTAYSILLGGVFGKGPGAYSEIYFFSGWLLSDLSSNNLQINISTTSNLLSEYGLSGFFVWLFVYLSLLRSFFITFKYKIFVSGFFILCVLYNRVLMDERIIFMIIFIFSILKINEKINNQRNVI
tara:strand:+ start:699 stop:1877 length:1179 start_codon:yes stop_codon:yes gene_type:complete